VASPNAAPDSCPSWCVTRHGAQLGEEDWVHLGEPLSVDDDVEARLCMSVDPVTGARDGPFFMIGSSEYTLAGARELAASLVAAADAAAQ
jgi:hypothetical protein